MVKYGTKRNDTDVIHINALSISGIQYSTMGYVFDLHYYQGNDSIFKAERLASKMPKDKGDKLIDYVRKSNERMEMESQ